MQATWMWDMRSQAVVSSSCALWEYLNNKKKKNCNKAGELQMLSGYNKGSCHAKHAQ